MTFSLGKMSRYTPGLNTRSGCITIFGTGSGMSESPFTRLLFSHYRMTPPPPNRINKIAGWGLCLTYGYIISHAVWIVWKGHVWKGKYESGLFALPFEMLGPKINGPLGGKPGFIFFSKTEDLLPFRHFLWTFYVILLYNVMSCVQVWKCAASLDRDL